MIPTLPQTEVMIALALGHQPAFISPPVRSNLIKRRWIAKSGTRRGKGGREIPTWEVTADGKAAIASSPHIETATRRVELGLQRSAWIR